MPAPERGTRVVSVHEHVALACRERGTVLGPGAPAEGGEPVCSVKWDGMSEPMDELAADLLPAKE
uniref:hypothetical protein n=1 Tax=Amycolatopsis sp. CA-096443 TaxID=3239919 RepID=UPI003F494A88